MRFQTMNVTPELAKKWLAMNGKNRDLRPRTVGFMKDAILRGEWKLSHQAIAITKEGHILDGQHRCKAIEESGLAVQSVVCLDADPNTFDVLDIGLKRTISDMTGKHRSVVGTVNFIAGIADPLVRGHVTPQQFQNYWALFGSTVEDLVEFCPKISKAFSSSAVRAAATLRMISGGDEDYIKLTYYQLNHREFSSLSQIGQGLVKQYLDGRIPNHYDMFARSWKVFDRSQAKTTKLQIKDITPILDEVRDVIRAVIKERSRTNAGKKLMKEIGRNEAAA